MTDSPTSAGDSDAPDFSPPKNERSKFVAMAIALASLLFVGTAAMLYLPWATLREPTCVLIIEAPMTLRGAEISVDASEITVGATSEPYKVTIGAGERFAIPFYLNYGKYEVRVTLKDQELYRFEANLTREQPGLRMDVTKMRPRAPIPTTSSTAESTPFAMPSVMHGQPSLVPPPSGADTLGRP